MDYFTAAKRIIAKVFRTQKKRPKTTKVRYNRVILVRMAIGSSMFLKSHIIKLQMFILCIRDSRVLCEMDLENKHQGEMGDLLVLNSLNDTHFNI